MIYKRLRYKDKQQMELFIEIDFIIFLYFLLMNQVPQTIPVNTKETIKIKAANINAKDIIKTIAITKQQSSNLQSIIAKFEQSIKSPVQLIYQNPNTLKYTLIQSANKVHQLNSSKRRIYYKIKDPKTNKIDLSASQVSERTESVNLEKLEVSSSLFAEEEISKQEPIRKEEIIQKAEEINKMQQKIASKGQKLRLDAKKVEDMQLLIKKIFLEHQSQITRKLFDHKDGNQSVIFKLKCCLCAKEPLKNTIFACQANLKVVICQQCSIYAKYQLPFPLKRYDSAEEYSTARKNQPKMAETKFIQLFQQEKKQRNQRIFDELSKLSI